MENHFRITAYNKEKNYSIIIESNGLFEKSYQFSTYLINKNLQIIAVGNVEEENSNNEIKTIYNDKMILRAINKGFPTISNQKIDGKYKRIITVNNFTYLT